MKSAKLKTFGILFLMVLISAFLVLSSVDSVDFSDRSPADGSYDLDGVDIIVNITVTPSTGQNITNISLWTNIGTYSRNQTITYSGAGLTDTSRTVGFIINALPNASLADGTDLKWAIEVWTNGTTQANWTENRTINIEYPPTVTLNLPANNQWSNASEDTFNFTAVSAFTSNNVFHCDLWANDSGTWTQKRGGFTALNNTDYTLTLQLEELSEIVWGIKCAEGGDPNVYNFSINRTIKIDRTPPAISLSYPTENTTYSTINTNIPFNWTVTELNLDSCSFYVNDTLNSTEFTVGENASYLLNASDGVYTFRIGCNDSAANIANISKRNLIIDTDFPSLENIGNSSVSGRADGRFFNFTSDEEVNYTIYYGTTTTPSNSVSSSERATIINVTINDTFVENTVYYFNITVCDIAGNCNTSGKTDDVPQGSFTYPFKLLTGWSYYGVYDAKINFSVILDQTEAEYVYYWNQTGQEWIYATSGGTSNMGFEVGTAVGRQVIALYESVNSTWARNTTNSGFYNYNFTVGDNFLKLSTDYTFGNLSRSFLNGSYIEGTIAGYEYGIGDLTQTPEGMNYNLSDFWYSAYNNSAVTWDEGYIYNWSYRNNTVLSPFGFGEVVWVNAPANITWNGTSIIANWTI
jgi:hypothetical protein